jgi:hypothetical protein
MATPINFTINGNASSGVAAASAMSASLQRLQATGNATAASMSRVNSAFGKAAAVLTGAFAASVVIRGLKNIADSASAVQVSTMAINSVFRDQAPIVLAAAESYEQYGLSISDFNQNAARLGAQQKSLGTSQDKLAAQTLYLMNVGSDLSATFGGDVSDAVHALSAAFRNEYDPIEKYGVTMKATTVTAKMAEEGISRSQAVLRLLFEQTKDIQGQAERQMDSYAMKSKRLSASFENMKADLGEGIMPAATMVTDMLGDMANVVSAIPTGVTQAATAATIFGTSLAAVVYAGSKAQSGLARLSVAIMDAGMNIGGISQGAMVASRNVKALGIAAVATAAYMATMNVVTNKFQEAVSDTAKSSEQVQVALTEISAGQRSVGDETAIVNESFYSLKEMMDATFNRSVLSNLAGFGTTIGSLGDVMPWGGDAVDDAKVFFDTLDAGLQEMSSTGHLNEAITVYEKYRAELGAMGVSAEQLNAELPQFAQALQANGIAFSEVSSSTVDATTAYKDLADAAADALSSINALNGITSGVIGSTVDWKESIAAVNQSIEEYGKSTNINTEAGQKNVGALNQQAVAANKMFNSMGNAGKSVSQITNRVQNARSAFIQSATAIGYSSQKANKLADDYGLIPDVVLTELREKGYEQVASAARDVESRIRAIPTSWHVAITISKAAVPDIDWGAAAKSEAQSLSSIQSLSKKQTKAYNRPWEMYLPTLKQTIRKGVLKGLAPLKKDLEKEATDQWKAYVDKAKDAYTELRRITVELVQQRKQMRDNLQQSISAFNISNMLSGVKDVTDRIAELRKELNEGPSVESWQHITVIYDQLRAAMTAANPNASEIARLKNLYEQAVKQGPIRIANAQREKELREEIAQLEAKDTLAEQIQAQVNATTRFASSIETLRKRMGKSGREALKELVAMGPEAGNDLAEQLVNSRALMNQFREAYNTIQATARRPANEIAMDEYNKKIEKSIKNIYTLQKTWANKAQKDLEEWLAKKGKKNIELEFTVAGNGKNKSSIAAAPLIGNLTINGAIDPEGTARAVNKVLAQHSRRSGR